MTALLSWKWQVGKTAPTLPATKDKLEKDCRSYRRKRRAAAAVEFAIVALVFFLLILGMVEYGQMVLVQQVITNALREGARQAVLEGATTVTATVTSGSISGATVTVTPNPPTNAEFGEPVTVMVSIPFSQVSWLRSPMYLGGKTRTATTEMRCESVQ